MLNRRTGKVTGIVAESHGVQEVSIEIGGQGFRAVNYPALSGVVSVGDQVVVNTTAVDLGLGTGGVHFVISNLSASPC